MQQQLFTSVLWTEVGLCGLTRQSSGSVLVQVWFLCWVAFLCQTHHTLCYCCCVGGTVKCDPRGADVSELSSIGIRTHLMPKHCTAVCNTVRAQESYHGDTLIGKQYKSISVLLLVWGCLRIFEDLVSDSLSTQLWNSESSVSHYTVPPKHLTQCSMTIYCRCSRL